MSLKSQFVEFSYPLAFAIVTFFGAVLLFFMEPLIGKSLLPQYGGTPAVWNTCVLFFQAVLLLGYVYVHLLQRNLQIRAQVGVHSVVMLLALASLPFKFRVPSVESLESPVVSLLYQLVLSVGFVFFLVSTTAPLMQTWYTTARIRANPYWLYVASNAGSLLGLLLYPLLIEAWLPLSAQCKVVSLSIICLCVLTGICAGFAVCASGREATPQAGETTLQIQSNPISTLTRWNWFILSACPSIMMMGVTTFLSAEIAPIPATWMLPLGIYLLSFMIAFAQPPQWFLALCSSGYVVLAVTVAISNNLMARADLKGIVLHSLLLLLGALALHGRLSSLRPNVEKLTEFYLWVSIGGVFGSLFSTILAPLVFNWLAEYPLVIAGSLWLLPWPLLQIPSLRDRNIAMVFQAMRFAIAAIVLTGLSWNIYFSDSSKLVIHRERSFFGSFHVVRGREGVMHQLVHGTTVHGMQIAGKEAIHRTLPLTYYFPTGPIGQIFQSIRGTPALQSVGIVGLGVGVLASYAEKKQEFTFYEIDPAIDRVARNPFLFSFLSDAEARSSQIQVVIGDARLKLREAPDAKYGMLVLDAFTSDCVPVHLLTREAIREYLEKLKPEGILVFHISNNYVNLEPVLASAARDLGLVAFIQRDTRLSAEETRRGKSPSIWMMMSRSVDPLQPILKNGRWKASSAQQDVDTWTDEQSNLLWTMLRGL